MTMEYYSAIKNDILFHATTWMNPKSVMLDEKSQSQKTTYCAIPFIWNVQKRQAEVETRLVIFFRGGGVGRVVGDG